MYKPLDVVEGGGDDSYTLFENCGHIFIDPVEADFTGLKLHPNISGELAAVIELLWHCLYLLQIGFFSSNRALIIFVDCLFVKDVLNNKVTVNSHP